MACLHILAALLLHISISIANDHSAAPVKISVYEKSDKTAIRRTEFKVMSRKSLGQNSIFIEEIVRLPIKLNETSDVVSFEIRANDIAYLGWSIFYKEVRKFGVIILVATKYIK